MQPLTSTVINSHALSLTLMRSHRLSHTLLNNSLVLSSTPVHSHRLSCPLIGSHSLSLTLINSLFSLQISIISKRVRTRASVFSNTYQILPLTGFGEGRSKLFCCYRILHKDRVHNEVCPELHSPLCGSGAYKEKRQLSRE